MTKDNSELVAKLHSGKSPKTHCERFDAALTKLTQDRSRDYGHPYDDFGTVAVLVNELKDVDDPRLFHIMYMICVKLSRLKTTPDHFDSWADIAGYARTACMVLDHAALTKEKTND